MNISNIIKQEEIDKYKPNGVDFVDKAIINELLQNNTIPEASLVRAIIDKSKAIQTLNLYEASVLMRIKDNDLWDEIFHIAAQIKTKVYDNRIVTFAPLYCSNLCLNNCAYCGFRSENKAIQRRRLKLDEVQREIEVLVGSIGHKRLIAVFGEHEQSNAEYIAEVLNKIYSVKVKARNSNNYNQIRRVNVNAAPLSIADFKKIKEAGVGTYQIFQETYHPDIYKTVHHVNTIKGNYSWRLYALHRAMESAIDDVAIGALLGLADWRFEVLGLLSHALSLEKIFGIGPHTISVPRIEPAINTPFVNKLKYQVSDSDFKKIVAILRLAIPYAGIIVTCRESPEMINSVLPMCTQRDASSRIGIGDYSEISQHSERQQFSLTDSRSLDTVIYELAKMGYITSFCTAGYRCGRTGKNIMQLLRTGKEGCFCKLNAVLTFQEWLDDFASKSTKEIGEMLIKKELEEIAARVPKDFSLVLYKQFLDYYQQIKNGKRDLSF